jgi:hypothetical protein
MKKSQITILSVAAVVVLFTGCSKPKDGATGAGGATGAQGPLLSGNVKGYVDLFDAYGDLAANASNVYVTVPGISVVDSTSTNGMFTKNLTTGTYELDYTKSGYGTAKIISLNFVGGGTQYITNHIQMTQPPVYSLSAINSSTATVAGQIAVTLTVTPSIADTKARKVICFIGTNSSVSYLPTNYTGFVIVNIPANATSGVGSISTTIAYESGIPSGSSAYIAAYPIAVNNTASIYSDISTGKTIYNNINFSSSVTTNVIVP